MRRPWASLTVGALALLVAVVGYLLVRSTSQPKSGSREITFWARFRDASGLFEKSRVQTAGIEVGQIERRELDPVEPTKARITVRLFSSVGTLYENAVVSKKSKSLLGEYYLEIDPGTPMGVGKGERQRRAMRVLDDGDQIKYVNEPSAMGDVLDSVGTLLPTLRDILRQARRLTSEKIPDITQNIDELIENNSEALTQLLERVDANAAHLEEMTSAQAGEVKGSIKNVRQITESIRDLIGKQGPVESSTEKMQSSIARLQTTIDHLDRSMKDVERITDRINRGDGTLGHLVNDGRIADDVEGITDSADAFVRSYTNLQMVVGLRGEWNVLAHRLKSYLSVQLTPRPDKFYLIELVQDPRGNTNTVQVASDSSRTGVESDIITTTTDQLRFSFMFGKRISFGAAAVAGRFGIKESTGGVGADLYLFDDRLSLSVDVFNFAQASVNQYPRVKVGLAWEFWPTVGGYLVAGADDLLDYRYPAAPGTRDGSDLFVGAMLRFNDRDLKSLLLLGGGAAAGAASK